MTAENLDLIIEIVIDKIIKNEKLEKKLEQLEKEDIQFSERHIKRMKEIFDSMRDGSCQNE